MTRLFVHLALTALLGACAGVLALQALSNLAPLPEARAAVAPSATGGRAEGGVLPATRSLAPVRLDAFAEALERPLFVEGRRPPAEAAPAPAAMNVRALPLAGTTLLGVVGVGEARIALLSPPGGTTVERVREGASYRGWRLVRAEDRAVLLMRGEVERRLTLHFGPASASAAGEKTSSRPAYRPMRTPARAEDFLPY